jgi:chromate reductase, NAD(P)H dehydrogenase (quinone)
MSRVHLLCSRSAKNAIDWASRPYGDNAWEGKPVAVMSASIGMIGGARAQYHLRQIFVFLNMYPINQPEGMMPFAEEKVDNEGKIADKVTRELIKQLSTSLIDWTRKILKE